MRKYFNIMIRCDDINETAPSLQRWDILRGLGGESIVINKPVVRSGHNTLTVYPYKRGKTKVGRWLWFKILKLKIWLKIINP